MMSSISVDFQSMERSRITVHYLSPKHTFLVRHLGALPGGGWPQRREVLWTVGILSAARCRVASRWAPDRRATLVSAPTLAQLAKALSDVRQAVQGKQWRPAS